MALPFLEAMRPSRAEAQAAKVQRFFALFYPNGGEPSLWEPPAGTLDANKLPSCLQDLNGFKAEGIWPDGAGIVSDVTVVTGVDHSGVETDIHLPSMSLSAHKGIVNNFTPPQPTLDQYLAESLRGSAVFRNLALAGTNDTDISNGNISFKAGGQPETVYRNPQKLFDTLFGQSVPAGTPTDGAAEAARKQKRQTGLLDLVLADAKSLNARLGSEDQKRLGQYLSSVEELEKQLAVVTTPPTTGCTTPTKPASGGDWHSKSKLFIDLAVLAMACDKTRVVTLQYSDCWGVDYADYKMGEGIESVKDWSDHFISHKLDDTDRALDLDGLDRAEAMRIANVRVLATTRFKVRRFAYLVNALKSVATPTGTLLDESLAMYTSEHGDGDVHGRTQIPYLFAGHAGGFKTGRVVAANGKNTGSMHASIISRFGLPVAQYGDPVGTAFDF